MENIDIASYADDNTPYITGNSMEEVIQKLESASRKVFQWFSDNQTKANPDKCLQVSLTIENKKKKQ